MSFKTNSKYCLKYVWGTPFRGATVLYVVKQRKQKHSFFILSHYSVHEFQENSLQSMFEKAKTKI